MSYQLPDDNDAGSVQDVSPDQDQSQVRFNDQEEHDKRASEHADGGAESARVQAAMHNEKN